MCFSTNNQALDMALHASYTEDIERYFLEYKAAEA